MEHETFLIQVRAPESVRHDLERLRIAAGSPIPSQAEIVRQCIAQAVKRLDQREGASSQRAPVT